MEESSESSRFDSAPPSPPRWKGVQSLDLVRQLNLRSIELLCRVAENRDTVLDVVTLNREAWIGVDPRSTSFIGDAAICSRRCTFHGRCLVAQRCRQSKCTSTERAPTQTDFPMIRVRN